MSVAIYVGDSGPVPATVTDAFGNPITPESATATVVNIHTSETVALNEPAVVSEGAASWIIPSGHVVSQQSARYVVYITITIDEATKTTVAIPLDVLDKESYFTVDRWRRKVEFAAPNEEAISDEEARDWVDQAVDFLGRNFGFTYTSTLAHIEPAADRKTVEYIAEVAGLMARTAWWAGKGNWRDEEMSFDGTPFEREWERLEARLRQDSIISWFTGRIPPKQFDMYNRDKVDRWGIVDEPDDLFDQRWLRDPSNKI
jgi:hypothetical protein